MNSNARQATISRFTNLLDGGIIPRASVSEILDYYENEFYDWENDTYYCQNCWNEIHED